MVNVLTGEYNCILVTSYPQLEETHPPTVLQGHLYGGERKLGEEGRGGMRKGEWRGSGGDEEGGWRGVEGGVEEGWRG